MEDVVILIKVKVRWISSNVNEQFFSARQGDWMGLFNSFISDEVEIALFLIENLFSIKNPNAGKTARPRDSCCQSVNL